MKTKKRTIMKKKYVSPGTLIVNVKLPKLMGNSLNPNATGNQKITPDASEPSPEEFTSRRKSVWDDEEEEGF